MRSHRFVRAALAATALVLLGVTAPAASAHDTPTDYLLDPAGTAAAAIFPEGIAARGDTFYVGSTTDGTVYRGDLRSPTATPFLAGGADGRTSAVGMKVDGRTLFVAGGGTGRVFAYDVRTGELTGSWQVEQTGAPTFLNDIAISPRGDVYVTDSLRPALYRIAADERRTTAVETLPTFLDFTGTALTYATGFNVNGIVISPDGRYAVVAQSNTATLYRVGLRDRSVTPVAGVTVAGDGLVLTGRTLYAVERQGDVGYIVTIALDRHLTSRHRRLAHHRPALRRPDHRRARRTVAARREQPVRRAGRR